MRVKIIQYQVFKNAPFRNTKQARLKYNHFTNAYEKLEQTDCVSILLMNLLKSEVLEKNIIIVQYYSNKQQPGLTYTMN